jgi:hypothetical protein
MTVSYNYFDDSAAPENGSQISWWRQRTGIEYATFSSTYILSASGSEFLGIATFNVKSLYNQDTTPFILSVTVNSVDAALFTKIVRVVNVVITDRGANFIGVDTSLEAVSVLSLTDGTGDVYFDDLSNAITVHMLSSAYSPGYATTSGFVRIDPNSPIGYADTTYGFSSSPVIISMPDYSGRLFERTQDIAARTLFDYRDSVYVQITPSNGVNNGDLYQSNTVTLLPYYTPVINNLSIVGSISSFNGISTSLSVNNGQDQVGIYSYFYASNPYQQYNAINWYKLSTNNPILLSSSATLSSSLITVGDQIYYTAYPGVIRFDGTIGFGQTVNSDVFAVI